MKDMLKQWTRFFMTNNEKKKRNSREGVASYLKKKNLANTQEGSQ